METLPKRRRIVGPAIVILLALNLGWLARLELRAQQPNNLVEPHYLSLEKGEDSLAGLKQFYRQVGNIKLMIDDWLVISSERGPVIMSQFFMTDDAVIKFISEASGGDSGTVHLQPQEFFAKVNRNRFEITERGEAAISINDGQHRLVMSDRGLDVKITKDNSWSRLGATPEGLIHVYSYVEGEIYGLTLNPDAGSLVLSSRGASLSFIETASGNPTVKLYSSADIELEADGNITLEAPNGEVLIKGKTVHLNEEGGA